MLLFVNFFLSVLAAIPVCIYFCVHKDRVLSGYLLALSALFVFSAGAIVPALSLLDYFWFALTLYLAAYVFHCGIWLYMAFKRANVREQFLQLLSISVLLLVYGLYTGNLATMILTVVYTVIAVRIHRDALRNKAMGIADEESSAPLEGIFKEFAPQRALYINEKKKEYE